MVLGTSEIRGHGFRASVTRARGFGAFWDQGSWFGALLGRGLVVLAISRIINTFSQAFQKHR